MVILVFLLLGCLSLCQADEIAAGTLTVKTPDPATGQFIVGVPTLISFDLSYTVTITSGTVTPTAVKLYLSNADGGTTSSEVTATGTPTTAVTDDGTFSDLSATLTVDAANCAAYTKIVAKIEATGDTDGDNNEASVDFGSGAGKAGIKVCEVPSTVADDPTGGSDTTSEPGTTKESEGGAGTACLNLSLLLSLLLAVLTFMNG
ncbi:uncharacterized protein [Ptychodera flava]|uniref:uncharacterized protein n=1 Tax=Ptychodera flava TaxID=63121 RepID=UPI00396A94E6